MTAPATAWELHDDPEMQPEPDVRFRFLNCLESGWPGREGCSIEFRAADGTPNSMRHSARLGSPIWTCLRCGSTREADTATQEDLSWDPWPASCETANSSASSTEDSAVTCSTCRGKGADVQVYYAELGKAAQLLPWCFDCLAGNAGLVVAAGYPLTVLPLNQAHPGYFELRRQLDRIQTGDGEYDPHAEAKAAVRRIKSPSGRKPGEWK